MIIHIEITKQCVELIVKAHALQLNISMTCAARKLHLLPEKMTGSDVWSVNF